MENSLKKFNIGQFNTKLETEVHIIWSDEYYSIGFYYVEDENGIKIPYPCRWLTNGGYFFNSETPLPMDLV